MNIRKYAIGEEKILYEIFYSSVHENAQEYYTRKQLDAWASKNIDEEKWKEKIKKINPFVVLEGQIILAYADLQENGYIDHFFVKGGKSKKGIGKKLITKIINEARIKGIEELTSDVSLAAQLFFEKNGFKIISRKKVVINGVELENARMKNSINTTFV